MVTFIVDREYNMKINSSTAHRSTQGFRTRRVRVLGPVEDGKLPILDLSGILGGLLGGARRRQAACGGWQRQRSGGARSRGAAPGLSVGRGCAATVWARLLTWSGLLTLRGVVLGIRR